MASRLVYAPRSAFGSCTALYLLAAVGAICFRRRLDETGVGNPPPRGLAGGELAAVRKEYDAVLRRGVPRVRRHFRDADPGARQLGLRLLSRAGQGHACRAAKSPGRR